LINWSVFRLDDEIILGWIWILVFRHWRIKVHSLWGAKLAQRLFQLPEVWKEPCRQRIPYQRQWHLVSGLWKGLKRFQVEIVKAQRSPLVKFLLPVLIFTWIKNWHFLFTLNVYCCRFVQVL